MRKKKFYKKHKIAIILGLLATANLSIIGFATFGVLEETIQQYPEVEVQVGDVTSENQSVVFTFANDAFTSFQVHTDGFYDTTTKSLTNKAKLSIVATFNSTLTANTNFEISLTNSTTNSSFDFFSILTSVKFTAGSHKPTEYSNDPYTLTYSDVPASELGVLNVKSGSLTFTFEFTVNNDNYENFYSNVFKKIHGESLTFALSIKNI